jgi:hypothetical protein
VRAPAPPVGREVADWIDDLLVGSPGRGMAVMLKVRVDESGIHNSAPAICVASCWTTSTQWGHLTKDWAPRAARYKHGYHATKASDEDNAALAALVRRRVANGIALTIAYDDFNAVVSHTLRSRFGAEYVTALRVTVLVLSKVCQHEGYKWMSWILEAGCPGQSAADRLLTSIAHDPEFHLHSHTWASKADLTTHAADLIAHLFANERAGISSPLSAAVGPQIVAHHVTREELSNYIERMERVTKRIRWQQEKAKHTERGKP